MTTVFYKLQKAHSWVSTLSEKIYDVNGSVSDTSTGAHS